MCAPGDQVTRCHSRVWLSGALCSPHRLLFASILTVRQYILNIMSGKSLRSGDWVILSTLGGGAALLYFLSTMAQAALAPDNSQDAHWLLSLFLNLLGYATIFLPGYYVIQYVRNSGYLDIGPSSILQPLVRLCVQGTEYDNLNEEVPADKEKQTEEAVRSTFQEAMSVLFCGAGLIGSYATWGYLQEKIMTTNYVDSEGNKGMYKNSQFLVFVNRILALFIALVVMNFQRQPRHKAPLFKYSYCSFSNIMSSWCQYEALKYVSFPTQVLAKASKVIPVMAMGKVVSNKKYEYYEYVVAVLISVGMVAFLFGKTSGDSHSDDQSTTFAGFIILVGYMCFDSFTSNWQGALYTEYKMSSIQMMAGVNLFSCLLTSVSLLQQGVFVTSFAFMTQYSGFTFDCVTLSICSAVGQLFIFHTISSYGPVVFTIIMTCRQVVSVVLSCIMFHHALAPVAILGIFIIFSALTLKIYCGYKMKMKKKAASSVNKI